ncbi:disease resistance protein RPP5 [Beta vulgaris subsp. vulgaris]|uniref:disease resistance protein RPP5 n=1 Tax=Beta vulgaris subsp. vulgaris TaxID=3555 RepID=UPI0020369731|nr:disease resistance protein RPP5 [Beta vulgaris subsp. vulgaris]
MAAEVYEYDDNDRFSYTRKAGIEVSRVYDDGYLYLEEDPVAWIISHPAAVDRLSVRILELSLLLKVVEKITDMIGELSELTHLYFYYCKYLKCVPDTITRLSKLQLLKLVYCGGIKSLPNSLENLSNLTTLDLYDCPSLTELPPNLNIVHLIIKRCCNIKALPIGLSNLDSLHLEHCSHCLANLKDSINLRHLTLWSCDSHFPADVIEFPANLDELLQLSLVDIKDTKVRYLPWSITKLLNLQILCLPWDFILETLPYHLDDSIIISIDDCHVRKTWKELKTEIGVKKLGTAMFVPWNPSILSPPGYLRSDSNNRLHIWLQNNELLQPLVKFLNLKFSDDEVFGDLTSLKELTHLYISCSVDLQHLPDTLTNITHLSLHHCYTDDSFKSLLDSLAEPSNLVSLDLNVRETYLLWNIHQFVNLKCLTVRYAKSEPLVSDNLEKLSNLNSLVLCGCGDVSLPTHLNLANLKLVDCVVKNVNLLPTSLHRLEILHRTGYCLYGACRIDTPIACLNQLVNLKTLSITCYKYTSNLLPSIAGLRNLKELQLKDCFGLKELPPDLDELVELSILNISGTRIKSFPDCITKLQKLKHVILPKCFRKENLPNNSKTKYITDDTDEEYYKHRGYYSSEYETSNITSDEINEITVVDSAEIADKVVSEYSQEGIIAQQISPHQLLSIPNANQFLGDYCLLGRSDTIGESSQDQEIETSGLSSDTHEMNISNRIFETEYGIPSLDWYISPCVVLRTAIMLQNLHRAGIIHKVMISRERDRRRRLFMRKIHV